MQSLVLDPPAIYSTVDKLAISKVKAEADWLKIFLLSFVAGAFIAVGVQTFISITANDGSPPTVTLGAVFFSTGLMSIILCGAELFTGNCLMMIAVFEGHVSFVSVLLEWSMVWFGNFVGCIAFAALNHGGGINKTVQGANLTPSGIGLCAIASKKAWLDPQEMFFRAWLANFCVCISVLIALSSKTVPGKVYGCIFPLTCFIVDGYEHSIANMYFFAAATMTNCDVQHSRYWVNIFIVTTGNFCGAMILAVVYWKCFLHGVEVAPPRQNRSCPEPCSGSTSEPATST